jgi:6,7-dimethyl-8-ribityllumazine synthase
MSTIVPLRPDASSARRTFAIVASEFNAEYVQGLVDHASAELRALAPAAAVNLYHVPGAFEIPVVVKELAATNKADVILAIGVILQGSTPHAEHLARSVTDGLQRIAIDHGIPVINAVLSLEDEVQARERCLEETINRGTEAGRAAVGIADVMDDVRK